MLEATRPASIVLLDPHPDALPSGRLPENCQVTRLSIDRLPTLPALGRFDLGIVANTLEYLDRRSAGSLLAGLRDRQTRRFVALVPIGTAWTHTHTHWETADLLAFGMSLMARYRVADKPVHLYHYAIESYKATPEWFNSRHWAHPERWRP